MFGKKVIPFEVFPFSRFYRNSRKFLYDLSSLTSARVLTVVLPRMLKIDLKEGGRFTNVYRYNVCHCSSVVLADVLEHNCNLAGENQLTFVVVTCVFLSLASDSGFQACSVLIEGKHCGCWLLIFLTKCGCCSICSSQTDETVVFFSKKQFSKSSDKKTSSTTGNSAVMCMFLVDMYPDPVPLASETSDQTIRFNYHLSRKSNRKFHSSGKRSLFFR